MGETIDWPPSRPPRRRGRLLILAVIGVLVLAVGTAVSYYVDALWFGSLGYGDVFWKTLRLQSTIFSGFTLVTFLVLYGSFLAFTPDRLNDITGGRILIQGQPLSVPAEPGVRAIALVGSLVIAVVTGASMTNEWTALSLYWSAGGAVEAAPSAAAGAARLVDPIFNKPIVFYLFTLPAWQLITGWLMTLAVVACGIAIFFITITSGTRLGSRGRATTGDGVWRGPAIRLGIFLPGPASGVCLGASHRLFPDPPSLAAVPYREAHGTPTGLHP